MLPDWDPGRLVAKIPFNVALVGGRRMGKSSAVSDLLRRLRGRFDLVIAFIGSASCNPVLRAQMAEYWDDRFFFSVWDDGLINRLLQQQEELKPRGLKRSVCLLMDDVILDGPAQEQMAHMAMRGRHFNISLMMCSVSYTCLPKRARRSLDFLLIYSLPMSGDMQILSFEFCQRAGMARWALKHLGQHECLVLETLQRQQKLFKWRAEHVQVEPDGSLRNRDGTGPAQCQTEEDSETPAESPAACRPEGTDAPADRTPPAVPGTTGSEGPDAAGAE